MSASLLAAGHDGAVHATEAEYVQAACAATAAHVPVDEDPGVCVRCQQPWPCRDYLNHRDALNYLYQPLATRPACAA
jgi:hypothetical protein